MTNPVLILNRSSDEASEVVRCWMYSLPDVVKFVTDATSLQWHSYGQHEAQ